LALLPDTTTDNDGTLSVSVALLLPGLVSVTPAGAATVTVLVIEPVAFGSIVPVSVMLTLCPFARLSPLHSPVAEL
jgi:hypothetical protein